MRNYIMILGAVLALVCPGCSMAAKSAQSMLEPFQVYVESADGQAASGLVAGANARYIAVAGHATGRLAVYAPTGNGHARVWSADYAGDYQPHAWEIKLWEAEGEEWLQVVGVTWEVARASLRHLPEERPMALMNVQPLPAGSEPVKIQR